MLKTRMSPLPLSLPRCLVVLVVLHSLGSAQPRSARVVSGNLTILGFTLGKSTLAEVQARLGRSEIKRCSRDEGAPKELCYASAGSDHTGVVFEAGFSGGWERLEGFK